MASLMDFKTISTRYDFVGNYNFLADGSKISGFWVTVNRPENTDGLLSTGYQVFNTGSGDYSASNIAFNGGGTLNNLGYDVFAGQLVQQNILIDRDGALTANDQRFVYGFGAADTVDTISDYAYSSSQFTSSRAYNFAVTTTVYNEIGIPVTDYSVNSLTLDWTDRITSKGLLSAKLNAGATLDEGVVYPEFSQAYSDPSMMDTTVTMSSVSFAKGTT